MSLSRYISFIEILEAERVIHYAKIDRETEQSILVVSIAIKGTQGTVFGIMKRKTRRTLKNLLDSHLDALSLRTQVARELEDKAFEEGVRVLFGHVRRKLFERVYRGLGYMDTGDRVPSMVGDLMVIKKELVYA